MRPDGLPLLTTTLTDKGAAGGHDWIATRFRWLLKKAGMEGDRRKFATLRKSAANEIEKAFPESPHLASLFLAHSETATKKHYVERHFDLLDKATEHLERLYAL